MPNCETNQSYLYTQPPHQSSEPRVTRDLLSNLAKRLSSKLEDGDFKGAVRITCSEDTMADLNEETLSALHAKHPPLHPDSSFSSPLEIPTVARKGHCALPNCAATKLSRFQIAPLPKLRRFQLGSTVTWLCLVLYSTRQGKVMDLG